MIIKVVLIKVALISVFAMAAVSGIYIYTLGATPIRSRTPTEVPDLRDTKIWTPLKNGTFINLEDGIPWSISYFYIRLDDPRITGKETAFLWDIDTPVHKVLRRQGEESYQWLLRSFGWTPPIRGENMEPILRVDWSVGGKVISATLLVYDGDSRQPSAWETFHDPLATEEKDQSSASRQL